MNAARTLAACAASIRDEQHGQFFDKLSPRADLPHLWKRARLFDEAVTRASNGGREYALEEMQASDANEAFWRSLEVQTGLTRAQIEERL